MAKTPLYTQGAHASPLLMSGFFISLSLHILGAGIFLLYGFLAMRRPPPPERAALVEVETPPLGSVQEPNPFPLPPVPELPPAPPAPDSSAKAQEKPSDAKSSKAKGENKVGPKRSGEALGSTSPAGDVPVPQGSSQKPGTVSKEELPPQGTPTYMKTTPFHCIGCHLQEAHMVFREKQRPKEAKRDQDFALLNYTPAIADNVRKSGKDFIAVWLRVAYSDSGVPEEAVVFSSSGDKDIDWAARKIALSVAVTPAYQATPFGDKPAKFHLVFGVLFAPDWSKFSQSKEWKDFRPPVPPPE